MKVKPKSEIKHEKAYETLLNLMYDENWMIRFSVVKALSKFKNFKINEPLEKLSNDKDIDVREAAQKILKQLSQT